MLRTGKGFVKIGLRQNIKIGLRVCYGCVKVRNGQSQGRSEGQRRSDWGTIACPPQPRAYTGLASWKRAGKLRARASCKLDELGTSCIQGGSYNDKLYAHIHR